MFHITIIHEILIIRFESACLCVTTDIFNLIIRHFQVIELISAGSSIEVSLSGWSLFSLRLVDLCQYFWLQILLGHLRYFFLWQSRSDISYNGLHMIIGKFRFIGFLKIWWRICSSRLSSLFGQGGCRRNACNLGTTGVSVWFLFGGIVSRFNHRSSLRLFDTFHISSNFGSHTSINLLRTISSSLVGISIGSYISEGQVDNISDVLLPISNPPLGVGLS